MDSYALVHMLPVSVKVAVAAGLEKHKFKYIIKFEYIIIK